MGTEKGKIIIAIAIVVFFLFIIIIGKSANQTNNNEPATPTSPLADIESKTMTQAAEKIERTGTLYTELTEDEYKDSCTEMWNDDVFFSKSSLEGSHVKLDVFITERRYWSIEQAMASPTYDFIKKYNLKSTFYYAGINREDEDSYIGGQLNIYLSKDYDCSDMDIDIGNHFIIYGEIVDYATITTSGYNTCRIVPKYIDIKPGYEDE